MLCKRFSKLICCLHAAVNFVMDVYSVIPGPWTISICVSSPWTPSWTRSMVDYPRGLPSIFENEFSELILGTLKAKGMKVCQFLVHYQD